MTSPAHPQPAGDLPTWRLTLPLTSPLSMNDREHWRPKAKRVAALRKSVAQLTRNAGVPPCPRIAVELHYVPRDRRRRDPLNLVATLKPCEDGIVDAGVVPDDTELYVEPTMPRVDPPSGTGRGALYLLIRQLPALELVS